MKYKSLETENWAGFPGKNKLEFSVDDKKPVTVIHAENGNGKTRLLAAIRYALYGSVPSSVSKNELIDMFALQEDSKAKAKVELTFIDDESGISKEYKVIREVDPNSSFSMPHILEYTKSGWEDFFGRPAAFIEQKLPERLADIFLFSGETLLDSIEKGSEKELMDSINTVAGVEAARETAMRFGAYYKKLKDRRDALTSKEKTNKETQKKIDQLSKDIEKLEEAKNKNEEILQEHQDSFNQADEALNNSGDEEISDANAQENNANEKIEEYEVQKDSYKDDLKKLIQEYGYRVFTSEISFPTFKEAIKNTVETPLPLQPADQRDALLNKLREDVKCICGRPFEKNDKFYLHIVAWLDRDSKQDNTAKLFNEVKEYKNASLSSASKSFQELKKAKEKTIVLLDKEINFQKDRVKAAQKIINKFKGNNTDIPKLKKQKAKAQEEIEKLKPLFEGPLSYDQKIFNKNQEIKKERKNIKVTESKEIDLLNKKIEFMQKVIDQLNIERKKVSDKTKENIHEMMNDLCKKYSKLGYSFEFKKDSYIPQLITEKLGKELPLSEGTAATKTIFYGASLVSVTESNKDNSSDIIEPGCSAPWVCDAPFSKLDPGNLASCGKVVTSLDTQLIIFVRTRSYDTAFKEELKKTKTLGKQALIQRYITGKAGEDVDTSVEVDGEKYDTVKKSSKGIDYSKILSIKS